MAIMRGSFSSSFDIHAGRLMAEAKALKQKVERRSAPPLPTGKKAPRKEMAWIPAGTFLMGANNFYPEEAPVRRVSVEGFWMDIHPVTNRQFAEFVGATEWKTAAEQPIDPEDYPGALPDRLEPSSLVFTPNTASFGPDKRRATRSTIGAC